mmetsp:Transcript_4443/g.7563  ORF Transcript_4443/g.7563 Transcript_4443/m.7563 type:complete len:353 (+) Transcript_4443:3-1061(+)
MLLNFLTNACKHTDEGSVHVNVSLCSEPPAGRKKDVTKGASHDSPLRNGLGKVSSGSDNRLLKQRQNDKEKQMLFEIVDSGVGVAIDRQDSLFEVFSQAQTGQATGTGLGLFSVHSRCTRLGGACGLISPNASSGVGSSFWFTVPYLPTGKESVASAEFSRYSTSHGRCRDCPHSSTVVMGVAKKDKDECDIAREGSADVSDDSTVGRDTGNGVAKKSAYPFTAFVVDDSQPIRKLLKRTLLGMGFTRVVMFENGKRALDAMKLEVVDVVFMDIQMPVMSGPEAVHRLREFERKTENRRRQYVVAVSANIEDNVVGVDGFDLERGKPIREKDIVQCMDLYTTHALEFMNKEA